MTPVIVFLLLAVAVVVFFARAGRSSSTRPPSDIARTRLRAQIIEVRKKLGPGTNDGHALDAEVARARAAWVHRGLAQTSLSSLDIDGIGQAAYESLRRYGIQSVADLDRLRSFRIPGFGHRKAGVLLSTFRVHVDRAQRDAQKLTWEELDEISGGAVGRLRAEAARTTRAKSRDADAAALRLGELERRLRTLEETT